MKGFYNSEKNKVLCYECMKKEQPKEENLLENKNKNLQNYDFLCDTCKKAF